MVSIEDNKAQATAKKEKLDFIKIKRISSEKLKDNPGGTLGRAGTLEETS